MTDTSWIYLPQQAMGMAADFMANPFRSTELSKAELLMRESIQNCADEKKPDTDGPVSVSISKIDFLGDEKARIVEKLKLKEVRERAKAFPKRHGWFGEATETLNKLDDPEYPFSILMIEDRNTNGLGGQWSQGDDINNRFHNLVLSIGDSSKFEQGADLLGSFGVGKMVYALTSNIRTIAYYSTFEPSDSTANAHARFMATGFFPKHKTTDHQVWTGHAFLGAKSGNYAYPSEPLVDEDAHKFVKDLGFEPREPEDTGLTVFLFDCPLTISECIEACEKYWWPRIVEESSSAVNLEFFENGKRIDPPRPTRNPALQPFIECYRLLKEGQALPGYELLRRVPKTGLMGGSLCLRGSNSAVKKRGLHNSVALIRRGLVVRYQSDYAREGAPEAIGVFSAANDNLQAFTLSEPEAHDRWNPNNDRLRLGLGSQFGKLIDATHSTIKNVFRDFQIRLEERKEKALTDDVEFLDQILGPIFDKKTGKTPPPPAMERAISIHKHRARDREGEHCVETLNVTIGLTDKAPTDVAFCKLAVSLKPLANADGVAAGELPRSIYSEAGDLLADASIKEVEITLEKGSRTWISAVAHVHPSWKARWVVTAYADNRD